MRITWPILLCVSISLSCERALQPPPRLNVVLISVDTLRADHLGIYGYDRNTSPNIDRFFRDHEIYERAYSTHACTPSSVMSLLSGLYPTSHGVRFFNQKLEDGVRLLPDFLKDRGYATAGIVSTYVLADRMTSLGRHFDSYDDRTPEKQLTRENFFERNASKTADAAIEWLRADRSREVAFLLWIHFIDPHGPYTAPSEKPVADFTHSEPRPIDLDRVYWHTRLPGVDDGLEYIDRYDEEIAYTDHHVGRILNAATELGLDENTIFVLTADHGETMLEHEIYFAHCYNVWQPILHIPMLIARPGDSPIRVQHPVSGVDLTPSLLQYATGALAKELGFDGIPFAERGAEDVIHLENQHSPGIKRPHVLATVQGERKWFSQKSHDDELEEWSVDIELDPSESKRAPWRQGDAASYLRAWNTAEGSYASRSRRNTPPTDLEVQEALKALGYLR